MVTIVIPVYNSEDSLNLLCSQLINTLEKHHLVYEIIMVDDRSKDNSYLVMQQLYQKYDHVKCVRLKENTGQQNTTLCGLRKGNGDYYITIDDDLQNNPEDIIALYQKIQEGYDVVYAVSGIKQQKSYRNMGSRLKEILFALFLGKPFHLKLTSFRIMNRWTRDQVSLHSKKFTYISASILQYTKNIANIHVEHHKRLYGLSNYTPKMQIMLLLKILLNYSFIGKIARKNPSDHQYIIEEVLE